MNQIIEIGIILGLFIIIMEMYYYMMAYTYRKEYAETIVNGYYLHTDGSKETTYGHVGLQKFTSLILAIGTVIITLNWPIVIGILGGIGIFIGFMTGYIIINKKWADKIAAKEIQELKLKKKKEPKKKVTKRKPKKTVKRGKFK